ncbi:hypothetical protein [Bosea thiooxidans]
MKTKLRSIILAAALPFALSACVQSQASMQLRQMSPSERVEAGKKAEVNPAGISTIQFKELGETARHRKLAGWIREVWAESCDVTASIPAGYSPAGSSHWRVKCRNTPNLYDYFVAIPERASSPARVMQCQTRGRVTECSIVGRQNSAG